MTISMYKASVPVFLQFLTSLSAVLDKAAAYAEAKKVEPAVLLNTRLAPDMFPLVRQVRAATDHAINGQSLLLTNALPNFYFHCTTAYDILRQCGIELGKRDFMGTPVSL